MVFAMDNSKSVDPLILYNLSMLSFVKHNNFFRLKIENMWQAIHTIIWSSHKMITIGNITKVHNSFWFGRMTTHYGLNHDKPNPQFDKMKYYAIVVRDQDVTTVRNMFVDSFDETNIYFEQQECRHFCVSDTSNLIKKYDSSENRTMFLVEYIPSTSIAEKHITLLDAKNEIDEKLKVIESIIQKM
jgi:hypothetical protein